MRAYEILYIVRPTVEEDALKALVERFDGVLTSNGATIIESKEWGKRRLAYEIDDLKEGFYHLIKLDAEDSQAVDEFDRLAKFNNDIIRHIIVRDEQREEEK